MIIFRLFIWFSFVLLMPLTLHLSYGLQLSCVTDTFVKMMKVMTFICKALKNLHLFSSVSQKLWKLFWSKDPKSRGVFKYLKLGRRLSFYGLCRERKFPILLREKIGRWAFVFLGRNCGRSHNWVHHPKSFLGPWALGVRFLEH